MIWRSGYRVVTMSRRASFQRILLPMDFSPHARAAAAVAENLARELDASIRFLTVLDVSDLRVALKAHLHGFTTNAEVRLAVEKWVEEQYASLSLPSQVHCERSIERGMAVQQIFAAIAKYRPHLVVMGSSGLARRLPIGSKTAAVLGRSGVPVVVCRKP
jgi:nucleotide-binding universal stress UspA family protein